MSTPAMVAASVIKLMVISIGVFWVVSFGVSRVFVFYEAYTEFQNVLKNEAWLRTQCIDSDFYSNLRQHTELCDGVLRNSERSPFLIALNAVAETANLCGRYTCMEALSNAGWPVIFAGVVTVLFAPTVLVRVVQGVVMGGQLPRYGEDRHLKNL